MTADRARAQPAAAHGSGRMPAGWSPELLGPRAGAAFRHARRSFLREDRIDMNLLATELGINRVTLYRWFGRREDLLVRILWSLAHLTLQERGRQLIEHGWTRRRVPEVLSLFVLDVLSTPAMRTFLRTEGDLAMRLLTTSEWGFQNALLDHITGMLDDDVVAAVRSTEEPLADLAFAAVRIIESFVHLKRITGEDPDPDRAHRVLHVLLG